MNDTVGSRKVLRGKDVTRQAISGSRMQTRWWSYLPVIRDVPRPVRSEIRNIAAVSVGIFVWLVISSSFLLGAQRATSRAALSPQELAGKKVFVQRCSICHLPPLGRTADAKPYGPILNGYMKNPEMEARAQEVIRKGGVRMPGFQYGLEAKQIDDVIAYLKTIR